MEVFMDIKVSSVHFNADKKLLDLVNKKINKLIKFYEEIIGAEVFLRLENTQELENKVAEIKLMLPGNELFAKKQSKTFEEATENAVEALRQQIIKHKEKVRGV
jgi:putative sigma-54 modulation protein